MGDQSKSAIAALDALASRSSSRLHRNRLIQAAIAVSIVIVCILLFQTSFVFQLFEQRDDSSSSLIPIDFKGKVKGAFVYLAQADRLEYFNYSLRSLYWNFNSL